MATYSWPVSIQWGPGPAPASVYVIDGTGTAHAPTLTSAIAETPTGSGVYAAVATLDDAWGAVKDWWVDAGGAAYPGDGPPAGVNVTHIDGAPASEAAERNVTVTSKNITIRDD